MRGGLPAEAELEARWLRSLRRTLARRCNMNSTDRSTLAVLKTVSGLLDSDGAAPVLLTMISGVVEASRAASEACFEEVTTTFHALASRAVYRDALRKEGVPAFLVRPAARCAWG